MQYKINKFNYCSCRLDLDIFARLNDLRFTNAFASIPTLFFLSC